MPLKTSTLRPGLLVSLKTSITGNVRYYKTPLEAATTEDNVEKARWETERVITEPKEHEAAKQARNKAGSLIRSLCANSTFGLLCPKSSAPELEKAITEARKIAGDFNSTARLSRISLYIITGEINPSDEEAIRAINSEVRDLIAEMADGIDKIDVKRIREAASKARNIGSMLSPDAQARIQIAIDTARATARKIVAAGESASAEIDTVAIRKIKEQSGAFLDLDEPTEMQAPAAQVAGVDLTPSAREDIGYAAPKAKAE